MNIYVKLINIMNENLNIYFNIFNIWILYWNLVFKFSYNIFDFFAKKNFFLIIIFFIEFKYIYMVYQHQNLGNKDVS